MSSLALDTRSDVVGTADDDQHENSSSMDQEFEALRSVEVIESPQEAKRRVNVGPALFDTAVIAFTGIMSLTVPQYMLTPRKEGFYCNDDSIGMPHVNESITGGMMTLLLAVIIVVPIVFVEMTRIMQRSGSSQSSFSLDKHDLLIFLTRFLQYMGSSSFGLMANYILCMLCAFVIGRLRPNFLEICEPVFDKRLCEKPTSFVEPDMYTCNGEDVLVKYSRLSFFCVKTSSTTHCAVFAALYMEVRLPREIPSKVVRPLVQVALLSIALAVGSSALRDYESHLSDVAIGFIVGTLTALYAACFCAGLFVKESARYVSERETQAPEIEHTYIPSDQIGSPNDGDAQNTRSPLGEDGQLGVCKTPSRKPKKKAKKGAHSRGSSKKQAGSKFFGNILTKSKKVPKPKATSKPKRASNSEKVSKPVKASNPEKKSKQERASNPEKKSKQERPSNPEKKSKQERASNPEKKSKQERASNSEKVSKKETTNKPIRWLEEA